MLANVVVQLEPAKKQRLKSRTKTIENPIPPSGDGNMQHSPALLSKDQQIMPLATNPLTLQQTVFNPKEEVEVKSSLLQNSARASSPLWNQEQNFKRERKQGSPRVKWLTHRRPNSNLCTMQQHPKGSRKATNLCRRQNTIEDPKQIR